MQTYVSLVFFEARFDSPSGLSYIHFSAFPGNPIYARDLNLQSVLGRPQHLCGFPSWYACVSDIMFLQNSTDFIADVVMRRNHGSTCGLFVFFRLQFQYLPQGLSDITVFPFCLMTCLSFCSYPRPQGLLLHIACEPVGLAWLVERLCELGGAQAWRGWEVHSCNIPIYRVPCCAIQISGYQDVQKEQGCVLVPLLREIDVLVDTI